MRLLRIIILICFTKLSLAQDSSLLRVSYMEEDVPVKEFYIEMLQSIRANFKRINSIRDWDKVKKAQLGKHQYADYYYKNDVCERIVVWNFRDNPPSMIEYYFLSRALSFVYEKEEALDGFDEVIDVRSYFENGEIIRQVAQDCGAPNAKEYLVEEQERILKNVEVLNCACSNCLW